VNERAAKLVQAEAIAAKKQKLTNNVFEQNIQSRPSVTSDQKIAEDGAMQARRTAKRIAFNPFEENIKKMREEEEQKKL